MPSRKKPSTFSAPAKYSASWWMMRISIRRQGLREAGCGHEVPGANDAAAQDRIEARQSPRDQVMNHRPGHCPKAARHQPRHGRQGPFRRGPFEVKSAPGIDARLPGTAHRGDGIDLKVFRRQPKAIPEMGEAPVVMVRLHMHVRKKWRSQEQ